MILLVQRIKNQKWFREKNYKIIRPEEIRDEMTLNTLRLIEKFVQSGGRTLATFIDKIDFFKDVSEVISGETEQERQRRFSVSRSSAFDDNVSVNTRKSGQSFLSDPKQKFRETLFQFIVSCAPHISEQSLTKILDILSHTQQLSLLSSLNSSSCTPDFKK